ncbi:unnamed protein product, partial [Rotaria sp. Silwood2]
MTKYVKDYVCIESEQIAESKIMDMFKEILKLLAHLTEIGFTQQIEEQPSNINTDLEKEEVDLSTLPELKIYLGECAFHHLHVRIGNFIPSGSSSTDDRQDVFHSLTIRLRMPFVHFLADQTPAFERVSIKRLLDHIVSDWLDEHEVYNRVIASQTHETTEGLSTETATFYTILREHRCLVILGDPGCGKTSFLRWLTYLCAELCLKKGEIEQHLSCSLDQFALGPYRIPILVRVGELDSQLALNP